MIQHRFKEKQNYIPETDRGREKRQTQVIAMLDSGQPGQKVQAAFVIPNVRGNCIRETELDEICVLIGCTRYNILYKR